LRAPFRHPALSPPPAIASPTAADFWPPATAPLNVVGPGPIGGALAFEGDSMNDPDAPSEFVRYFSLTLHALVSCRDDGTVQVQRLQQHVIDAARALLAHQQAGFRVPLGEGCVAMAGDARDIASLVWITGEKGA